MINYLNSTAQHWFDWQFAMLWQTAVLIAIIWLIDVLIRKWAHPQVRYALWMLILVKLLIPPTWTSPASVTSNIPSVTQKALTSLNSPPVWPEHPASDQNTHSATTARSASAGIDNSEAAQAVRKINTEKNIAPATTDLDQIKSGPKGQDTVAGGATSGMADSSQSSLSGATQPKQNLHWQVYAMFTWLAGILVLSFWLIVRLSGLRREHLNDSTAALPERFHIQLQEVAQKLNLKRIPRVVLTDKVACPAVFGIFKPVLLMPAAKFKTMTRQDTEHILLHELAHIKRGDLLVHAVYMIAQIAYWFNPLIWMARRPMQNLRELCCDATVAKLLRDKTVHYRQTLLETARQLLAEPVDPGLGLLGLFENNNWLVTRLQWLEKNTWKKRPWRIATIIALVAVMTTCVLPMANETKVATEDTENDQYKKVLDNGATVEILGICEHPSEGKLWWRADGTPFKPDFFTEQKGQVSASGKPYEIAVKVDGPEDLSFTWKQVKGAAGSSSFYVQDKEGNDIDNIKASKFIINPKLDSTHIELGIAAGKWTTRFTHGGHGTMSSSREKHGIAFSKAYQMDNDIEMTVSDDYFDADYRLIAIGKNGDIHTTNNRNSNSGGKVRQSTFTFKNLNLEDIKEFQFQTRPYEYVTFKNLALRPDKVDSKVEVSIIPEDVVEAVLIPEYFKSQMAVSFKTGQLMPRQKLIDSNEPYIEYAFSAGQNPRARTVDNVPESEIGVITGNMDLAPGGFDLDTEAQNKLWSIDTVDKLPIIMPSIGITIGEYTTEGTFILPPLDTSWPYITAFKGDDGTCGVFEITKVQNRKIYVKFKTLTSPEEKSTNSEQPTTNYSATLPNSITVELLGVCEHPSNGKQWWTPDGSPFTLPEGLVIKESSRMITEEKLHKYEFLFKYQFENEMSSSCRVEGSAGTATMSTEIASGGTGGYQAEMVYFKESPDSTTVHVSVATGPWQTKFSGFAKGDFVLPDLLISAPIEKDGNLVITAKEHGYNFKYSNHQSRIVLKSHKGDIITTNDTSLTYPDADESQLRSKFKDIQLDEVQEISYQTRSSFAVTFNNVALRPDGEAEVEIEQAAGNSQQAEENSRIRVAGKLLNKRDGKGIHDATIHFVGAPDDNANTYPDGSFATNADRGRFHQTYFWLDDKAFHGNQNFGIRMNNHIDEQLAANLQVHIDPENLPKGRGLTDEDGDGIFCDGIHCVICNPNNESIQNPQQKSTNSEPPTTNYTATLPNGVTVELVGLCKEPKKDATWWSPNGSEISKPPFDTSRSRSPRMASIETMYTFLAKATGGENLSMQMKIYEGFGNSTRIAEDGTALCYVKHPDPQKTYHKDAFEKGPIEIGIAQGQWIKARGVHRNDMATPRSYLIGSNDQIVIQPPQPEKSSPDLWTTFWATTSSYDYEYKVVFKLKDGSTCEQSKALSKNVYSIETGGLKNSTLKTIGFNVGKPIDQIVDYELLYRKFQYVQFEEVAFKPDIKTDVRATVISDNDIALLPIKMDAKVTDESTQNSEQNSTNSEPPTTNSQNYTATLPNGVTVELLGVCEHPSEGKQWWAPDGTPSKMAFITEDKSNYEYKYPGYEFVFKTEGIVNKGTIRLDVKGCNQQSTLTVKEPKSLIGWRSHVKPRYEETTIKMGILRDDWKTAASHTGYGTTDAKVGGKRIIFSPASGSGNEFSITVSDELSYDFGKRVIAIDKNGNVHTGQNIGGLGIDDLHQNTFRFKGVDRDSIKEFQFQTQEYKWVTFKNVALHPSVKTTE